MPLNSGVLTRYFSRADAPAVIERRVRRWAGAAAALIFGSAIAVAAVTRHIPKQHGGILLALEFAPSAAAIRGIVPADMRAAVMRSQRDDSFMLIPAYWALFATIGGVLVLSGGRINRICGWTVIAGVTLAAACDLRENVVITAALRDASPSEASPARWALVKWILLFLIAAVLSVPLLTRTRHLRLHANSTALLFLLAGLWGLWASARNLAGVPTATMVFALAIFLLALLFIWDPDFFAEPSSPRP
jgi:hypothetical protein